MTTLRQLAEAATPGPWEIKIDEEGSWEDHWPTIHSKNDVIIGNEGFYSDKDIDKADAAYIAAANPTAILALLDTIDAQRKLLERVNKTIIDAFYHDNFMSLEDVNHAITAHLEETE